MDPASIAKESNLNPPEKSKILIKYKHDIYILTNESTSTLKST